MSWLHLRRVIRYGVARLDAELRPLSTGPRWQRYLGLDEVREIAGDDDLNPPSPEEAEALLALLEKYDDVHRDAQFAVVARLWGFRTVYAALAEFVELPEVRHRRQLAMHGDDLDRALSRLSTGEGWRRHLALPPELLSLDIGAADVPPDPDRVRQVVGRYEAVERNRDYRVIAQLPAFQATLESLRTVTGGGIAPDRPGRLDVPPPPDVADVPGADEPADERPAAAKRPPSKPMVEELVAPDEVTPAVRERE